MAVKELRPLQEIDLAFHLSMPRSINLSDPGTGKTPPVVVYQYALWTLEKVRSAWAMPLSLMEKNRKEILEFTDFKPEDVVIVSGSKARRTKLMKMDAKVFIMGFSCFSTNWRELRSYHPDLNALQVDEIHLGYGGDTSQRTQALYDAMDEIKYFLPMTGSLINGRLSSAYPVIHILDPTLYTSYEHFLIRHAIEDESGKIVAWRNPKPIADVLRKYGIRHTFEEVYGKEAKIVINEQCQMDPQQRIAYDEFAENAILELEESWLEGTLPGVNFIRCRQLMEHPQTFGAPLDQIKLTGKEQRLLIHLENAKETKKPIVIFAALVPSQERIVQICKDMGLRVGLINGTVSLKKRNEIDLAFQAGEYDVVVASPATAGVGFNWGHVDIVIFMSIDFMDSSFLQGYRRAMRGVRKTHLLIYVMEYEDSVDQRIFKIVETKSAMAVAVDETQVQVKISAAKVRPPPPMRDSPPTMQNRSCK